MSQPLTAREVSQRLRDAALGVVTLRRIGEPTETGHVSVEIGGWRLVLDFEDQRLHQCEHCQCPTGREGSLADWQNYGTDPLSLLSTWELAQIERLLIES